MTYIAFLFKHYIEGQKVIVYSYALATPPFFNLHDVYTKIVKNEVFFLKGGYFSTPATLGWELFWVGTSWVGTFPYIVLYTPYTGRLFQDDPGS